MSLSHRGSCHDVRDPSRNLPDTLFFLKGFFVTKQRQWIPKSSTEMATRHHHLHVRVDDGVLGPFHRVHLLVVDSLNSSVAACYGSDDASFCLIDKLAALRIPAAACLSMFGDILLVNVSAV